MTWPNKPVRSARNLGETTMKLLRPIAILLASSPCVLPEIPAVEQLMVRFKSFGKMLH